MSEAGGAGRRQLQRRDSGGHVEAFIIQRSEGGLKAMEAAVAFGFGSIVAALIARWVAVSGHRQSWINALRDDLALFFKELRPAASVGLMSTIGRTIRREAVSDERSASERCAFILPSSSEAEFPRRSTQRLEEQSRNAPSPLAP